MIKLLQGLAYIGMHVDVFIAIYFYTNRNLHCSVKTKDEKFQHHVYDLICCSLGLSGCNLGRNIRVRVILGKPYEI